MAMSTRRISSTTSRRSWTTRRPGHSPRRCAGLRTSSAITHMSCFCNRRRPPSSTLCSCADGNGTQHIGHGTWDMGHGRNDEMTTHTTHTTHLMTCGLLVKSYDEALAFYTEKLGFVVVE